MKAATSGKCIACLLACGVHTGYANEPVQELAEKLRQCIERNKQNENHKNISLNIDSLVTLPSNTENYEQLWKSSRQAVENV